VHETKHGRGVSIENADELHETIAPAIVTGPFRLRGQEVRFLRPQLKLLQKGLARALHTTRASVVRWEQERDRKIPGIAEAALRFFYALKMEGHAVADKLLDLRTELDDVEHQITVLEAMKFRETEQGHWMKAAA
jgi:DNA-binding transcriptional regulator YiaG